MSTVKMPAFTAEATLYRSGTHYQGGAIQAGRQPGGEVLVQPALRVHCGMKVCCVRGWSGDWLFCCEEDHCYRV
jgi:hypothetical protein